MHKEGGGQRRIFVLDQEGSVHAHEARVTPQLGYRAAFRDKNSLGVSSLAVSARDAGLLRIDQKERVLDSDGEESELDGLLISDRQGGAFGDFSDFDGFQRFVGVKDQPDVVARIPSIALLDVLKKPLRAFLKNLGIFLVAAFLATWLSR